MFTATVHQFIKSSGEHSFIPTPSLDESDNVKLLQVVVKKNRKWLWESTQYYPTEYGLSQLLKPPKELTVTNNERKLTTFHRKTNFDLSGKFGVNLMKEFLDINLSAKDSVLVEADLGDINKQEVDIPALASELQLRYYS